MSSHRVHPVDKYKPESSSGALDLPSPAGEQGMEKPGSLPRPLGSIVEALPGNDQDMPLTNIPLRRNNDEEASTSTSNQALSSLAAVKKAANKWRRQPAAANISYATREKDDLIGKRPNNEEKVKQLARKFQAVNRVVATAVEYRTKSELGSKVNSKQRSQSKILSRISTAHNTSHETHDRYRMNSIVNAEINAAVTFDSVLTTSKEGLYQSFVTVIDYGNKYKRIWDWGIVLLTFYTLVVLPFVIAFPSTLKDMPLLAPFDVSTDVFFVVDIYLSFRTAFLDEDRYVVRQRKEIIQQYLRGGFAMDMLAAFPLEYLAYTPIFEGIKTYNWLRVNKLARVTRVFNKLDDLVLSGYGRILKLMGTFCVAAHVIACFYFALGSLQHSSVVGGRWVQVYQVIDKPIHFQYMSSLYWAFATLATVGYGDISARSTYERCFALLTMFLGSIMYASIFGTFTNLIQERDKNKSRFNEKSIRIAQFCRANNLPTFIRHRLLRYHETGWQLNKVVAGDVLKGVPNSAKIELMMFLYADLLTTLPLFQSVSKRFLEKVVLCFEHAIFLSGDYLIREGDVGSELYFVVKGYIEIYAYKGSSARAAALDFDEVVAESYYIVGRGPGAFIGEGALIYRSRRGASVLAVSPVVQTLVLTKESFLKCIEGSPEVLQTIREIAEFRQVDNKKQHEGYRENRSCRFSNASTAADRKVSLVNKVEKDYGEHRSRAADGQLIAPTPRHPPRSINGFQNKKGPSAMRMPKLDVRCEEGEATFNKETSASKLAQSVDDLSSLVKMLAHLHDQRFQELESKISASTAAEQKMFSQPPKHL